MSLVEKAKKKAREAEEAKAKEEKQKEETRKILDKTLGKLTKEVINGLKEFNGVKTKHGTLKFSRKTNGKQVAILKLLGPDSRTVDVDLLYVDASIESGYRDYSDDYRNVPYTEASVRIHTKERRPNGNYDYYPNYELNGLGLREYYGSISHYDDERMKKLLEEVAEWMSPLFGSK